MKISELFNKKNDVTIGYIGGSVTEGAGYRDAFTQHLKEQFAQNTITEINAGVGGTTSFLGVHRAQRDLISKNPDMVVIEFSINDNMPKEPKEYFEFFERTTEGLVRKILKSNPETIVMFVGLTTRYMNENFYDKGEDPFCVIAHKKVASHYNIPYFNVGVQLNKIMKEKGETLEDYTKDLCHTNEKGGKAYGDILWDFAKDYDFKIQMPEKPLHDDNLENACLRFAEEFSNCEGWSKGQWNRNGKHEDYLYSFTPGSEISLSFYGSAFGIYCTTEKTSGNILFSIDGGEWKEKSTWDKYAKDFDRLHYYLFEPKLDKANHTVKIKVSDKKEEESEGHYIRIIAFLVEE